MDQTLKCITTHSYQPRYAIEIIYVNTKYMKVLTHVFALDVVL